jgi:hypothetical protein
MCELAKFLFALVPWKRLRAFLIRKHLGTCPACAAVPPAEEECAALVRPPDWVREEASLWPEIRKRLQEGGAAPVRTRTSRRLHVPARRLVPAAAAGLAALALLTVLVRQTGRQAAGAGPFRVEVISAAVQGKEARPSIFQTKNASYIWFSQASDEGGRK